MTYTGKLRKNRKNTERQQQPGQGRKQQQKQKGQEQNESTIENKASLPRLFKNFFVKVRQKDKENRPSILIARISSKLLRNGEEKAKLLNELYSTAVRILTLFRLREE
jgi:hypothetical protein